ncbi:MAG TPA: dephospho-CoA kinase [Candidatus Limnocylindrales bacterium]|nr:dephospho-CoA kinase [Candidatus Limnocylindrales bacterium]
MKLVGLTGGIASGKSTVARILKDLGAAIVDADALSREVVSPGQDGWHEIVATFGPEVLQADQTLDRQKLRKLIFNNPEARKKLEAIIHPRVRALAEERIREYGDAGYAIVVYEVPLLFEGGLQEWLRPVILVASDVNIQRQRLQQRDGLDAEAAQKHIDAQMSLVEKRRLADYVIENNGTLADLEAQVRAVIAEIQAT